MDSRPQTLVYKLVIAASKKVVAPTRFDAAMSLGALCDAWSVWALVFIYTTDVVGKSSALAVQRERGSEPLIALMFVMGCDGVLVFGWQGRFETCPYGLVDGRVALMEMLVFGQGGWLVGSLLPNWAGGSGWLNDN